MKNIKILTFHSVKNYGAVLQTFALYMFLKNKYNSVQIIDFNPDNITFKPNWRNPLTFILYLKFHLFKRKMEFTVIW